jgi:hypothetical protein
MGLEDLLGGCEVGEGVLVVLLFGDVLGLLRVESIVFDSCRLRVRGQCVVVGS